MEKKINEDEYHCGICHELAIRPHVTVPCQHMVCETCVPTGLGTKEDVKCPICRGAVTTMMHDRMSEQLILRLFGDAMIACCSICGNSHTYAEIAKCGAAPDVVYTADDDEVTAGVMYEPTSRSWTNKKVVTGQSTPGRAMVEIAYACNKGLQLFHFVRDGKKISALVECSRENTLKQLKTMTMYLCKMSGRNFQRINVESNPTAEYVSTKKEACIDVTVIVNTYDALMVEPDVMLISKEKLTSILTDWACNSGVKRPHEETAPRGRIDANDAKRRKVSLAGMETDGGDAHVPDAGQ